MTTIDELILPYDTFQLDNGLTVIVHEDRKAPMVAVNVTYLVGAKDEPPGRHGFAHLFEHLMFGGSKNLPGSYLANLLKAGASDLNGTTSPDRTNYYETVPTSALDYALFAESDRMGHFAEAITQETLDQQRGVVANEWRQSVDRPYGRDYERILGVMYPPQHPYAHTVLGSMEELARASLADVRDWFAGFYGPNNAVLVLAGDIDLATARRKAEQFFGDIAPGRVPERRTTHKGVPRLAEDWYETTDSQVPMPRFSRIWNTPAYGNADATRLLLVADMLGGQPSARLDRAMVHVAQPLVKDLYASAMPGQMAGLFGITLSGLPQGIDVNACNAQIAAALADLAENGPAPDELERVKTAHHAHFLRGVANVGAVAALLSDSQRQFGSPDGYRRVLQQVREATPQNVSESVRRWLLAPSLHQHVRPVRPLKAAGAGFDRSAPPPVTSAPAPRMPLLQRATLRNGLKVVLAERHERPMVEFTLLLRGGQAIEPPEHEGLAVLTAGLLRLGAGGRNGAAFTEALLAAGATFWANAGPDWTQIRLSTIASTLDDSLSLMADAVIRPRFELADVEREQKTQRQSIAEEMSSPPDALNRVLPMLLYPPKHAYARPWSGSGTDSALSRITRADVQRFHAEWYVPAGATLIVVGDTSLAQIVERLDAQLGAWSGSPPVVPAVAETLPAPMRGIHVLDRPDASQSQIAVALFATPFDAAQAAGMRIADMALAGSFASRTNMNLREEKHWTYGVGSQLKDVRGPRPYVVQTAVQFDKTGDALRELYAELCAIVSSRPVSADEIASLKQSEAARLAAMTESMEGLLNAIEYLVRHELPDDHWVSHAERLLALDAGEVHAAMQRLVDPKRLTWAVIGDRARIDTQLLATGLGALESL